MRLGHSLQSYLLAATGGVVQEVHEVVHGDGDGVGDGGDEDLLRAGDRGRREVHRQVDVLLGLRAPEVEEEGGVVEHGLALRLDEQLLDLDVPAHGAALGGDLEVGEAELERRDDEGDQRAPPRPHAHPLRPEELDDAPEVVLEPNSIQHLEIPQ